MSNRWVDVPESPVDFQSIANAAGVTADEIIGDMFSGVEPAVNAPPERNESVLLHALAELMAKRNTKLRRSITDGFRS